MASWSRSQERMFIRNTCAVCRSRCPIGQLEGVPSPKSMDTNISGYPGRFYFTGNRYIATSSKNKTLGLFPTRALDDCFSWDTQAIGTIWCSERVLNLSKNYSLIFQTTQNIIQKTKHVSNNFVLSNCFLNIFQAFSKFFFFISTSFQIYI